MVDWEIYPIHKGFLDYPLDEEVVLDHLINLFKFNVNNLSIDLPSWKAKKLKTANKIMNIRKIKQHGISRIRITCWLILQDKFTYLYKIGFVQDLVLVVHNEYRYSVIQTSSFLKGSFSSKTFINQNTIYKYKYCQLIRCDNNFVLLLVDYRRSEKPKKKRKKEVSLRWWRK